MRFAQDGSIDAEISLPTVYKVTACCFGGQCLFLTLDSKRHLVDNNIGPNDDQMYITTAHCGAIGDDSSRQTQFPDSGHLFVVDLAGKYRGGKWRYPFAG